MSKRYFGCLFLYLFITFLSNAQTFEIQGQIINADNKKIYLLKSDGSPFYLENRPLNIIDSTIVKKGAFSFKGKIEEINNVSIKVKNGRQYIFILDTGKTTIIANANSMWETKIKNSKENDLYKKLWNSYHWAADSSNRFVDRYYQNKKLNKINASLEDSLKYIYYDKLYDSLRKKNTEEFILDNPSSFVSLSQLNIYYKEFGFEKTKKLLASLQSNFSNHSLTKLIHSKLEELANTITIGNKCPNFVLPDSSGKNIELNRLKSKVIIIDFWASWCAPCRQENPFYRKLYSEFKNLGLEIISISLDVNKLSWCKAIKVDKMEWINLSDLNGIDSDIAVRFGINAIPSNFIITQDGNVIGKNLKGEELYSRVKSVLLKT